MTYLSVTKDSDGHSGLIQLKIDDITFLGSDCKSGKVLIHTVENETLYTVGSLKYWTHVLNHSGYRFFIADRNNSVHIDKIVEMNDLLKVASFDRIKTSDSKQCTMSKSGYNGVLDLLGARKSAVIFT